MQVLRTDEFAEWLKNLRDKVARAKVLTRIDRLEDGNPGNVRSVGEGVFEMKIDFGPGYRVYYIPRGQEIQEIIVLLCGGDKSTQEKDIRRAKMLAYEWTKGETR